MWLSRTLSPSSKSLLTLLKPTDIQTPSLKFENIDPVWTDAGSRRERAALVDEHAAAVAVGVAVRDPNVRER